MSSNQNIRKVAFSITNCICHDQRVLRIAETVRGLDCDITIIGIKSGDCCNTNIVPFKTKRFKMIFRRGFLFYKFYNVRLFFHLLFNRYDILVANDLDTLLPNFIVSKLKHLPLAYDSHEYFTGVPELQYRPFVRWIWKSIEKYIFPILKNVMTVSDSIAIQYESEYRIKPITVRNCSRKANHVIPISRKELGVNEDHLLLILQGTGINIDRGGEELIEAIGRTENVYLLIVGAGNVISVMKEKVLKLGLSNRTKFFPKLPWEEMTRYTKAADAGLSLDKDTNMNYRFSLPNKVFDYISAGIPVIAGNLTEVSKIVEENKCGIIIPKVSPEEIAKAVLELQENPVLLSELKKNAVIASESVNWKNESIKVEEFYKVILDSI
jgi:glycosyltransferase involved in cell wall biosynthesis